jgi:tetratricopeptide (TPR) repeat protein
MDIFEYDDIDDENEENDSDLEYEINRIIELHNSHNLEEYDIPPAGILEDMVIHLLDKAEFENALIFVEFWLNKEPYSADANSKKGLIYLNLENKEKCLKFYQIALDIDAFDSEIAVQAAISFSHFGNPSRALEIVSSVSELYPDNEEVTFYKGVYLSNLERTHEAIYALDSLRHSENWGKEATQEIAFCYYYLGIIDKALEYFQDVIDFDPFDANAWFNKGVVYSYNGQLLKANVCYDYALAVDEDNFLSHYNKGHNLAVMGKLLEAIECYQKALALSPNDEDTLYNLGSLYADSGNYIAAIDTFTKVIGINNTHHFAYFGRGVCYDALELFDDALVDYNRALAIFTDNSELWYAKADLLYNLGFPDESIECYLKALEIAPDNIECWYDYGQTCFELNNFKDAQDAFNKLIELAPDWSEGYYQLAKVYAHNKNSDRVISLLNNAFLLDPKKKDLIKEDFKDIGDNRELKNYLNNLYETN